MSKAKSGSSTAAIITYFVIAIVLAVIVAMVIYETIGVQIFDKLYYFDEPAAEWLNIKKWLCFALWYGGRYVILGGSLVTAVIYGIALAIPTDCHFLNLIASTVLSALGGCILAGAILFLWWIATLISVVIFLAILAIVCAPVCLLEGGGSVIEGILIFFTN